MKNSPSCRLEFADGGSEDHPCSDSVRAAADHSLLHISSLWSLVPKGSAGSLLLLLHDLLFSDRQKSTVGNAGVWEKILRTAITSVCQEA